MAFLTLNGATFAVVDGSVNRRIRRKGKRSRAYRGQLRDGQRGRRRSWAFRACFKDHEEAETMARIINGEGHVVHFVDGFAADTGLQPELLTLSSVTWDFTVGPFSGFTTGSMVGDPFDDVCRYDPQFADDWTIMWWERVGGDWRVIANRSDGRAWLNGVEDTSAWQGIDAYSLRVEEGRVTVAGFGAEIGYMHQLVMLPFKAADTFITQWAAATKPWGGLPVLRMEGDVIATDHEYVLGEVTSQVYVQKPHDDPDFGWANNAEYVEFNLTELATEFVADLSVTSQGAIVAPPQPVVPLQGGKIIPFVLESDKATFASLNDKGPGVPTSTVVFTGKPTTEWSALVNWKPDGDISWAHSFVGSGSPSSNSDRSFITNTQYRKGDSAIYVTGWTEATVCTIADLNGVTLATLNEPSTASGSGLNVAWGFVCSFDVATGALNWVQTTDFDKSATSSLGRNRPQHVIWGGPDNDDLLVVFDVRTAENSLSDVPNPQWGTTTVAVMENINSANVGAGFVSTQWIVKIDPTTGDPISAQSHVANFNDNAPVFGTVNRGSVGDTISNRSNLIWNPVTQLWYLSSNYSAHGGLGVVGTYIGRGKAGEFQTRNTDEFGGENSVKAYICTFDKDLEPQNAVTLAPVVVSQGNNKIAYNMPVFLAGDSSGDVIWGWENMNTPPTNGVNLQRNGILGNYGAGAYLVFDKDAPHFISVRLDSNLEVVWEATAVAPTGINAGRGKSVDMVPIPNDSTKMLAMVTQWVFGTANDPSNFFGSVSTFSFDQRQSFAVSFDVASGSFDAQRELERAASGDKMQSLSMKTADSGPDQGTTFGAVIQSNDSNVTIQGFYDTSSVRQYVTSDYWCSNGAVYAQNISGAAHLVAYDANGELDPSKCFPLVSFEDGNFLFNFWAGDVALY